MIFKEIFEQQRKHGKKKLKLLREKKTNQRSIREERNVIIYRLKEKTLS